MEKQIKAEIEKAQKMERLECDKLKADLKTTEKENQKEIKMANMQKDEEVKCEANKMERDIKAADITRIREEAKLKLRKDVRIHEEKMRKDRCDTNTKEGSNLIKGLVGALPRQSNIEIKMKILVIIQIIDERYQ